MQNHTRFVFGHKCVLAVCEHFVLWLYAVLHVLCTRAAVTSTMSRK